MIRVLVAEDHTIVREGIKQLIGLAKDLLVVGEAGNGEQLLETLRHVPCEVVLLDIRMPRMTGIDALRTLKAADCMVPCIILTTFDDHQLVLEGLQAGARGYLLKDVSLDSLVDAINTVHAGGTLVQPALTERIIRGLAGMEAPQQEGAAAEALSPKELEVLRMMAGGYSNKEISLAVCKSEGTVKNQVSSILAKLDVRDRTQAVLRAINLGLL